MKAAITAAARQVTVRFDDTLQTVLAADTSTPASRASAWRQLVDLLGRGRVPAEPAVLDRLESLREEVPDAVRAASTRAIEGAPLPPSVAALLARDTLSVATPVLRGAMLPPAAWIALLPQLSPSARLLLRNRRDLGPEVERALESFGPTDMVLGHDAPAAEATNVIVSPAEAEAEIVAASLRPFDAEAELSSVSAPLETRKAEPAATANGLFDLDAPAENAPSIVVDHPVSDQPFGDTADPTVATDPAAAEPEPILPEPTPALAQPEATPDAHATIIELPQATTDDVPAGPFRIVDVISRIDAFQRQMEDAAPLPPPVSADDLFRFETDTAGAIRWIDGAARGALIGLSIARLGSPGASGVDAAVAGALRRRASFRDARLTIAGEGEAAGEWRLSGIPAFDETSGRFTGYRGTARRPRADERAERGSLQLSGADSLRQLVHELRTPAGAIAGFAEMIEHQLLGPVPPVYRDRAGGIHGQARELLAVIEDLDLAARIEGDALDLRPGEVALAPLMARVAAELQPLAQLRASTLEIAAADVAVAGDARAVERLLARLLATLVSATKAGEEIFVRMGMEDDGRVAIVFDRPAALDAWPGEAMLGIDDEREDGTLLGTGFALRLARNLASELGGALLFGATSLTLRLPAVAASPTPLAGTPVTT